MSRGARDPRQPVTVKWDPTTRLLSVIGSDDDLPVSGFSLGSISFGAAVFASVKDSPYNAVGDGVANDSSAVQAAIDAVAALSTDGGIVYFPAGVYLLTTGLTIGKGVRLIGAGKHASILVGNAAGIKLIETTSGAGGGQEIAYLQLQASSATGISLSIKGVDHVSVHDCRFYGAVATHISLDHNNVAGAYTHRIDNNELDCSVTASSVGIKLTNTQGAPTSGITSTVVTRNTFISDAPISYVNGAFNHGGNSYIGNLFTPRTPTVGVGINWTANVQNDAVSDNYFQNFASAMTLASGSGATVAHTVSGNSDDANTVFITNNNASLVGVVLVHANGLMQAGSGTRSAGDLTTTSGSFVDATDVTVTLTLGTGSRGRVYVSVTGTHKNDGANQNLFQIMSDGVAKKGLTAGNLVAGVDTNLSFDVLVTGLAAGAHIFKLQWTRTAGTATLYGGTSATKTTSIVAFELP